jgi:hypothetical protein
MSTLLHRNCKLILHALEAIRSKDSIPDGLWQSEKLLNFKKGIEAQVCITLLIHATLKSVIIECDSQGCEIDFQALYSDYQSLNQTFTNLLDEFCSMS